MSRVSGEAIIDLRYGRRRGRPKTTKDDVDHPTNFKGCASLVAETLQRGPPVNNLVVGLFVGKPLAGHPRIRPFLPDQVHQLDPN